MCGARGPYTLASNFPACSAHNSCCNRQQLLLKSSPPATPIAFLPIFRPYPIWEMLAHKISLKLRFEVACPSGMAIDIKHMGDVMGYRKLLLILLPTLLVGACGGDSGSKSPGSSSLSSSSSSLGASSVSSSSTSNSSSEGASSSSPASEATVTGTFVDSAVAGIGYRTETQEGVTNTHGEYNYIPGETVTFFIGDMELPPVRAKGVVTPLDIAGTDDFDNQVVVNIARLLQTLDADGDPSNGISIPASAAEAAVETNFDVPTGEFELATTNFIANAGGGSTTLISAVDAQQHLEATVTDTRASLIGTWYYRDTSAANASEHIHIAVTFLDHQTYVMINDESGEDINGKDGFEIGQYSWNLRTGLFTASTRVDTNGEWGLSHPCEGEIFTLEVRGDTLLFGVDTEVGSSCDEGGEGEVVMEFTRVDSDTDPMVGTWWLDFEAQDQLALVTFTADNTYLMMQNSESTEEGLAGIERGTYLRDPESYDTIFTTITDTNGQWGFSHPCAILDVSGSNNLACGPEGRDIIQTTNASGGSLTFISEADTIAAGEEEPVVFTRVDDVDPPTQLDLVVTNTLVEYNQGEQYSVSGSTMQCSFSMAEGESETFEETWYLSDDPDGRSYLSFTEDDVTEEADIHYDPATGTVSYSEHDPKTEVTDCIGCQTTYYVESSWSWEATYDPAADNLIAGTVTETIILTWDLDASESICTGTYEMTADLQP